MATAFDEAAMDAQAAAARRRMAEFDRMDPALRAIIRVVGNLRDAMYLYGIGARSEEDAEAVLADRFKPQAQVPVNVPRSQRLMRPGAAVIAAEPKNDWE